MLQDKIKKWRLQDAFSLKSEVKEIRKFVENTDKVMMTATRCKLELIGYHFDTRESFIDFCKNHIEFIRTQIDGCPLDHTISVYLKTGRPLAVFDIKTEITDTFGMERTVTMRADISNIPKYSIYKDKRTVTSDQIETKPIDKVTTRHLEIALRLTGIYIDKSILDRVIDMVELLEDKGGGATIYDIVDLKKKWRENNGK